MSLMSTMERTCSIYINGEEEVSQKVPKFALQDQDQTAWLATDRGTGFQSACIMDEVGLFNEALTADEIQGIMNDGIFHTAFAVEPSDKLPILWGKTEGRVATSGPSVSLRDPAIVGGNRCNILHTDPT